MRRSKFSLPGCCVDRALQTMRLALGYRKGMPPRMTPKFEYFVEVLIEDLNCWFPKHRCLVGVNIPISRVSSNVVFVGTYFDVSMADCVGIGSAQEVFYLPIQDVLVATSFKTSSRTAHMIVGVPAMVDFTERNCIFVLMVFERSVMLHHECRYPIDRYKCGGYELASAYVDGGWYSAR